MARRSNKQWHAISDANLSFGIFIFVYPLIGLNISTLALPQRAAL
jgi:hypothetical protein